MLISIAYFAICLLFILLFMIIVLSIAYEYSVGKDKEFFRKILSYTYFSDKL